MASDTSTKIRHYDTIILGAGMAGLSCASRLLQHQYYKAHNRLLVLEARDRIGGRIGAVHINGSRLDTGANWIHGIGTKEKPNPLLAVLPHKRYRELSGMVAFQAPSVSQAAEAMVKPVAKDAEGDWVEVDNVSSLSQVPSLDKERQGDLVIPSETASVIMGALWGMIGSLHEVANSTSDAEAKQTSMLQAITRTAALRSAYKHVPTRYRRTLAGMPQFVENMEAAPLAAQSAEHFEDSPGMGLLEFAIDDFDGDQVFLQDGYLAVIDEVAKELLNANLVEFGVQVKQIQWDAKPIKVETSVGTFTAEQVVCALPLGVLQHHQKQTSSSYPLFQPPLPQDKREAISSLGFGTLDKVFLLYDKPWWTEEPYLSIFRRGIVKRTSISRGKEDNSINTEELLTPDSIMGFTDELPGIQIKEDGTTSVGPRNLSLINLHNLTGFPVLSAFVSCANATYIESLTVEQVSGILHRAITTWFGRDPPKPTAVYVTRWAQDEFARGSYSHMIKGISETRHRETFQQPAVSRNGSVLRFAGEHTSRNHFATVHGALLSGWREADNILTYSTP